MVGWGCYCLFVALMSHCYLCFREYSPTICQLLLFVQANVSIVSEICGAITRLILDVSLVS